MKEISCEQVFGIYEELTDEMERLLFEDEQSNKKELWQNDSIS